MDTHKIYFSNLTILLILIVLGSSAFALNSYASVKNVEQFTLSKQSLSDDEITGFAGSNDQFGVSLAVDNGVAVIGAAKAKGYGVVYVYQYDGNEWQFVQNIEADDPTYDDFFGVSVSIKGDTIAVGAYHDPIESIYGSVYIFQKTESQWQQTQKIVSVQPEYESHYGSSVELFDGWLFIGNPGKVIDEQGDAGSLHIYKWINGVYEFIQMIHQPVPMYDSAFGVETHIVDNYLFVGATRAGNDEYGTNTAGRAYVFSLENNLWVYKQTLSPQLPIRGFLFGVSFSQFGNKLAVGSPKFTGGVYLYELINGTWEFDQEIIASDRDDDDWFGVSVKLSADELIVGSYLDDETSTDSGSVYVFKQENGSWVENQKIYSIQPTYTGRFGLRVETYDNSLLVGGYRQHGVDIRSGLVTEFKKDKQDWTDPIELNVNPGSNFRNLGFSISAFGSEVFALGKPTINDQFITIFNYDLVALDWVQKPKIIPITENQSISNDCQPPIQQNNEYLVFGSCSLNVGGNYSFGAVYIYRKENGAWMFEQKLTSPHDNDRYFGKSISIDNNRLVIASEQGVFVFEKQVDWQFTDSLWTTVNAASLSSYGEQVIVKGDRILVLGRKYENSEFGNEYLFDYELNNGQWQEMRTINNDVVVDYYEDFAKSFSWVEDKLVLASLEKPNSVSFFGAVHYYQQTNDDWVFKQTVLPEEKGIRSEFGTSVLIDSGYLYVGSPRSLVDGKIFGKVIVYSASAFGWRYLTEIHRSNNNYYQEFGENLAILDNNLVVSATRANEQGNDSGSIEVIDISSIDIIYKNGFD